MIRRKYSIDKVNYELRGQIFFFGRDNLSFKVVNFPKKQRLVNICKDFKLKKIINNIFLPLSILKFNEK